MMRLIPAIVALLAIGGTTMASAQEMQGGMRGGMSSGSGMKSGSMMKKKSMMKKRSMMRKRGSMMKSGGGM